MSNVSLIEAIDNYIENEKIPDILEQFFVNIARTGYVPTTWEKMRILFLSKLNKVVEEFYASNPFQPKQVNKHCEQDKYEDMKQRLTELVLNFEEAPFTIQRLCELLTQPKKNYTKCDKFMRGFEKNLMVVSSWKKESHYSHTLPKLSMNGLLPSNVDHTMIPSPVSTTPPRIIGGILFADSSQNTLTIHKPETTAEIKDDSTNEQVVSSSTDNGNSSSSEHVEVEEKSVETTTRTLLGKRKSESESCDESMDVDGPDVVDSIPEVKKPKTNEYAAENDFNKEVKDTLKPEDETKREDNKTENNNESAVASS